MKHKHHIIPKHMGGTDDPSNLTELTVEEHAEAHRLLYEQYGKKEDELAWKGLSGIIGKEELMYELSSYSSKKYWDNISEEEYQLRKNNAFGGNKFNRDYLKLRNTLLCSKTAEIITPKGEKLVIKNVKKFCEDNDINYQNMKTVLRGNTNRKTCSGFEGRYL